MCGNYDGDVLLPALQRGLPLVSLRKLVCRISIARQLNGDNQADLT